MKIVNLLSRLSQDKKGTSTVELALICAMIILAMMTGLRAFSDQSVGLWTSIKIKSDTAIHGSPS